MANFVAGSIVGYLKLDKSGWDQSVHSVTRDEKDLTGMSGRVSASFGGLWKQFAAGIIATQGISKAISGAKGLVKSIFDVGIETENYKVRLEALLGSQDAAADAMDYFREVAAKVPFTLQEVISSGTQLTAFGLDLKTWTPILTDLAAVMGMDLPEAASALGRAFAGGAGAADIFRERGILQIIKDNAKMKLGIEDITKLTLPQFRDVMYKTFTDPEGKITGAADKLSRTWTGTISMIQDKWFQVREKIASSGIFDLVKERLVSFNEKLDEWIKSGKMEEFAQQISNAMEAVFRAIDKLGKMAVPPILKAFLIAFERLSDKMNNSIALFDLLTAGVKGNKEEFEHLRNKMLGIFGPFKDHDVKLREITTNTGKATTNTNNLGGAIKVVEKIIETTLPKMDYFRYQIISYGESIVNTVLPAARDLSAVWKTMSKDDIPALTTAYKDLNDYFQGLYNDIATGLGNTIKTWMGDLLDFKNFVIGIWTDIKDAFFRMVGEMLAESVLNKFRGFFTEIGNAGIDAGKVAGEGLKTGISLGASAGAALALAAVGMAVDLMIKGISQLFKHHGMPSAEEQKKASQSYTDYWTNYYQEKYGVPYIVAPPGKRYAKTVAAQHGYSGVVTEPTMFLAGEHGAESVNISPNINFRGIPIQINLDRRVLARAVAPVLSEMSKTEHFRIHPKGVRSF